jgi:hypothetical protein
VKRPPKPSSGAHHLEDLILALVDARINVQKVSTGAYKFETDEAGPLVMFLPPMVGGQLVQQLMEHFGADEESFLPFLIALSKKRQH